MRSQYPIIQLDGDIGKQALIQASVTQSSDLNLGTKNNISDHTCLESDFKRWGPYWLEDWLLQAHKVLSLDPVDNKVVEVRNVQELGCLFEVERAAQAKVDSAFVQKLNDLKNRAG